MHHAAAYVQVLLPLLLSILLDAKASNAPTYECNALVQEHRTCTATTSLGVVMTFKYRSTDSTGNTLYAWYLDSTSTLGTCVLVFEPYIINCTSTQVNFMWDPALTRCTPLECSSSSLACSISGYAGNILCNATSSSGVVYLDNGRTRLVCPAGNSSSTGGSSPGPNGQPSSSPNMPSTPSPKSRPPSPSNSPVLFNGPLPPPYQPPSPVGLSFESSSNKTGIIAGAAAGAGVLLLVLCAVTVWCYKRRNSRMQAAASAAPGTAAKEMQVHKPTDAVAHVSMAVDAATALHKPAGANGMQQGHLAASKAPSMHDMSTNPSSQMHEPVVIQLPEVLENSTGGNIPLLSVMHQFHGAASSLSSTPDGSNSGGIASSNTSTPLNGAPGQANLAHMSDLQLPTSAMLAAKRGSDTFARDVAPLYEWVNAAPPHAFAYEADDVAGDVGGQGVMKLSGSDMMSQLQLVEGGLVGSGATAVVYKCLWPSRFGSSALLAAKVLKDVHNRSGAASFAHEVGVLEQVCHPNIVRMYGYCLEHPRMVIIMELLPISLKDTLYSEGLLAGMGCCSSSSIPRGIIAPWPRTVGEVLHVATGLTRGLAYLHSRVFDGKLVVHRDLKPPNILVSSKRVVKISDFGLARENSSTHTVQTAHEGAGTLRYMAPEVLATSFPGQFPSVSKKVTAKVDVYSLGIILWELVARQVPWQGTLDLLVPFKVALGAQLPFVTAVQRHGSGRSTYTGYTTTMAGSAAGLAGLPADFDAMPQYKALIEQCWQLQHGQRPSAEEVLQQLEGIMHAASIQ